MLHVSGLVSGKSLHIYNLYGQLIYTGIVNGDKAEIRLSIKGLYVIQSGKGTIKVMVND